MASKVNNRTRAVATSNPKVGMDRYKLYREAHSRIGKAIKQGFYLEAIAIIESLVSDRLESRLTFLKQADFSFKTLGELIKESDKLETDPLFKALVTVDLNDWRISRNKAMHEMAKLESGNVLTWNDRVKALMPVSKLGLKILRAIDKQHKKIK